MRRLVSLPAEAALRVINTTSIEKRLTQHQDELRLAYAERIPATSGHDGEIVRALKRDGVFITSLDTLGLPETQAMFAQAAALSSVLAHRTADVRPTRTATGQDLMTYPAIFAWGMQSRLLDVAQDYIGLPVAYDGLCYFYSLPDGSETDIRVWHLDREDRQMIKIAVYITDVGQADGPLQYVSRSATRRLEPNPFKYRPLQHAEFSRRLGSVAPADPIETITGPAGTVIFIDTAQQFHRGCPPTARSRSAIYYSYFSRPPRHPFFCERSPLSRAQLQTLVRTAEPCQRDAVLWRASLPRTARWVPPSRV
jgi:hypothetical protein